MARDITLRFQSADDMIRAIDEHFGGADGTEPSHAAIAEPAAVPAACPRCHARPPHGQHLGRIARGHPQELERPRLRHRGRRGAAARGRRVCGVPKVRCASRSRTANVAAAPARRAAPRRTGRNPGSARLPPRSSFRQRLRPNRSRSAIGQARSSSTTKPTQSTTSQADRRDREAHALLSLPRPSRPQPSSSRAKPAAKAGSRLWLLIHARWPHCARSLLPSSAQPRSRTSRRNHDFV